MEDMPPPPVSWLNTLLLCNLGQVTQPLCFLASLWCLLVVHLLGMICVSDKDLARQSWQCQKYLSMSLLSKEAKDEWQLTGDSAGDPILSHDRS